MDQKKLKLPLDKTAFWFWDNFDETFRSTSNVDQCIHLYHVVDLQMNNSDVCIALRIFPVKQCEVTWGFQIQIILIEIKLSEQLNPGFS